VTAPVGELPALPIPPPEMRKLVGVEDARLFDNPARALVYPHLPGEVFNAVFDFGCGCGRIARQLIQQILDLAGTSASTSTAG
jgi:hypothetical protein